MTIHIASRSIAQLTDLSVLARKLLERYPNANEWVQANLNSKDFYLFDSEVDLLDRLLKTLYSASYVWFERFDFFATVEKIFDFDASDINTIFSDTSLSGQSLADFSGTFNRKYSITGTQDIEATRIWLSERAYFNCNAIVGFDISDIDYLSSIITLPTKYNADVIAWIKNNTRSAVELIANIKLIGKFLAQEADSTEVTEQQLSEISAVKSTLVHSAEDHLRCPMIDEPPDEKTLTDTVANWMRNSMIVGFDSSITGLIIGLNQLGDHSDNSDFYKTEFNNFITKLRSFLLDVKPTGAQPYQFGNAWDYRYETSEALLILRYQSGCLFTHKWICKS